MVESGRSRWGLRDIAICVAVWLALALGFGALIGGQNLQRYHALVAEGVKTQGTVLATEPQNHQSVRYSYQVAGAVHEGSSNVGVGNPAFDSLHAGDAVLLYYSPSEPTSSVLGEPASRLRNEIVSVVSVMLLFPSLIVWRLIAKGVLLRS